MRKITLAILLSFSFVSFGMVTNAYSYTNQTVNSTENQIQVLQNIISLLFMQINLILETEYNKGDSPSADESIRSTDIYKNYSYSRKKGSDAAKKANLANLRARAELYYDDNDSFRDVCDSEEVTKGVSSADAKCFDESRSGISYGWAAETVLSDGKFFCVDYKGNATTVEKSLISATDVDCR